jgi:hypothetical protein
LVFRIKGRLNQVRDSNGPASSFLHLTIPAVVASPDDVKWIPPNDVNLFDIRLGVQG